MPETAPAILRFGAFELDSQAGELRRSGMLIKLAPQPLQILRVLAERSGEIVTRDEIRQAVWGPATFVDLDRSLNVAIAQIRSALNDDADSPRFVATIPKKGYRFVAPVEKIASDSPPSPAQASAIPTPQSRRAPWLMIGVAIGAAAAIAAIAILSARTASPQRPLIAVLPFEDPGDHALLREALLEDTIGQLSGIQPTRLGVIARTSSKRVDGKQGGIAGIASALNAQYIVEGSIRASGDRLRVSARLIQARDQSEIWSGVFEEASEQTLERDTPARIAAGVLQTLFPNTPAPKPTTAHCGAGWDAYRNGRYLQAKGEMSRAVEYFEQAGACAEADAARAESLIMLARSGRMPLPQAYERAGEAAKRALAADPHNAEALTSLANVEMWNQWRFADAGVHFRRALEINPSFAAGYHDYAWLLVVTGRAAEAVDTLRRALALDPLSPRVNIDAGWLLLQAHRFEEAAAQARRALELEPDMREALFCMARARAFASGTITSAQMPGNDPYYQGLRHALSGDRDRAFESLETAVRERRVMVVTLKSEPALASLHDDPRFRALVAKIGLP